MQKYPLKLEHNILNVTDIVNKTTVNGPGNRLGVWLQGCPLGCKGCWNPQTHNAKKSKLINIEDIAKKVKDNINELEGITFSGGEPFWQASTLSKLCGLLKEFVPDSFTFFCYSGLYLDEIKEKKEYIELFDHLHYLVSGRYEEGLNTISDDTSVTSSNQKMYIMKEAPEYKLDTTVAEIIFDTEGNILNTGFRPLLKIK